MSEQTIEISVMLAVSNAAEAADWYERALGARRIWDLGSVIGLRVGGSAFFVGEPENNGWNTPHALGMPSVRIEIFCDDPDTFISNAVSNGANARDDAVQDHDMPWGTHRQGSFVDPFGHKWLVGDRSPLMKS
jgi:PhnB protein